MSACSVPLTAALVLLLAKTPISPASNATSLAASTAQANEIEDLRKRVAVLDGQLKIYGAHLQEIVDASIRSSDQYRNYVSSLAAVVVGVFTVGGWWFSRELRRLRAKGKRTNQQLYVATYIAKAVADLLAAQTKEEPKKTMWTRTAYAKLLQVEKDGRTDADWLNWKAYFLRRLGDTPEALNAAQEAVQRSRSGSPQRARALYNVACYSALLGHNPEALRALRDALVVQPPYGSVAVSDEDFSASYQDPDFKKRFDKLVGQTRC